MLAWRFIQDYPVPAYTLNPTNVDEYCDFARLTGIRGIYRFGHSHTLNQKAVAEFHARSMGRRYEDCRFIVAHIDGGITVGAHDHGRMVDGSMGADGEGSFSPTRIGYVPVLELLDYLQEHSLDEVRRMCSRSGGFVSLFGTSNSDTIHAPIHVYPGEMEQDALALSVLKVLRGQAEARIYSGKPVWQGFEGITF